MLWFRVLVAELDLVVGHSVRTTVLGRSVRVTIIKSQARAGHGIALAVVLAPSCRRLVLQVVGILDVVVAVSLSIIQDTTRFTSTSQRRLHQRVVRWRCGLGVLLEEPDLSVCSSTATDAVSIHAIGDTGERHPRLFLIDELAPTTPRHRVVLLETALLEVAVALLTSRVHLLLVHSHLVH